MLAIAKGTEYPTIDFEICQAAGDKHVVQAFQLSQCVFSNYQVGGGSGGGRPVENVGIVYGKVKFGYTPIEDGKPGAAIEKTWDLIKNVQG